MPICDGFGCRVSDAPTPSPTPRVQIGVWGEFLPYTPNVRKCLLKIRHLQALGVGGVEGAVRKIFGLLYIRVCEGYFRLCGDINIHGCTSHRMEFFHICWRETIVDSLFHQAFPCRLMIQAFTFKVVSPDI